MSHEPFTHVAGSRTPRIIMIGEAWGEREEQHGGIPFVGATGREFARMLIETGWDDSRNTLRAALNAGSDTQWIALRNEWAEHNDVMLTNVFALRPINNNIGYLCTTKENLPHDYAIPAIRTENPRYVEERYLSHLSRLRAEVECTKCSLILALGGVATWALVGSPAIGKLRGAAGIAGSGPSGIEGVKYLATYHPASIFRAWHWRPIILADLIKARREMEFPEVRRPARSVIINPSLDDVTAWATETLYGDYTLLAPDIETMNGQIRCIGFARSRSEAIVIPFIRNISGQSYWADEIEEYTAWNTVRELLESDIPKVFQNGIFDLQYLLRAGLSVKNAKHDTMLLHHAIYPEMQKGLGFLGSVYTNEAAWKTMRLHKGEEELKRDE